MCVQDFMYVAAFVWKSHVDLEAVAAEIYQPLQVLFSTVLSRRTLYQKSKLQKKNLIFQTDIEAAMIIVPSGCSCRYPIYPSIPTVADDVRVG